MPFSLMTKAGAAIFRTILIAIAFIAPATMMNLTPAFAQAKLHILYIDRKDDNHYKTAAAYTGAFQKNVTSPFPAAELALNDSTAAARAAGLSLELKRLTLEGDARADVLIAKAFSEGQITAAILDLPLAETEQAALLLKPLPVALFNARHPEDALRSSACSTHLFHTLPSTSMATDALGQWLLANGWRRLLLLEGPLPQDKAYASALSASAKKFGLSIVEQRPFVTGHDPRKRDQINVKLLTSGAEHDIIIVADSEGSFGRNVAYNTAKPRPVAGTHGLTPSAWHVYFERYGAPQLNRRFQRSARRLMRDEDWATWVAVRAAVDSAILSKSPESAQVLTSLVNPDLRLELYKALPGSFRPWNHQLRQAMLLGTADAVTALAPLEGALHQHNQLDTLGPDAPESKCAR